LKQSSDVQMVAFPRPRGLFDPYYVPERLLFRDNELDIIGKAYRDSYEDEYGVNCLVHGIAGVGRTVFSRYFVTKIVPQKFDAHTVYVDARNKSILEIMTELNDKMHSHFNRPIAVTFDLQEIWTQFRQAAAHSMKRSVFVIDNVDETKEDLYLKLAQLSKEIGAGTIGVLNSHDYRELTRGPRGSVVYDLDIRLRTYTRTQLYEIVHQRVEETFPLGLSDNVLRYITDIVCEFDGSKPKTTVEALKFIWPHASRGEEIDSTMVRKATTKALSILSSDEYMEIMDALASDDYMTLLVLEALSEHLTRFPSETYIDRQTLNDIMEIKCEEMGIRYNLADVDRGLEILVAQSIVMESGYCRDLLYVVIPPETLWEMANHLRTELEKIR